MRKNTTCTIMGLKYKRKYIISMAIAFFFLYCIWLPVVNEHIANKRPRMKYILEWKGLAISFINWASGQEEFLKRKCRFNNCYITSNRTILESITNYDAIAFLIPEIGVTVPHIENRSLHQKYVYMSLESAEYFQLCDEEYDGFFNWTCTYKLDSDLLSGYMVVRNMDGDIIGPKQNMDWITVDLLKPADEQFRKRLKTKKTAAAWFVSNIRSLSKREDFAVELRSELKMYHLQLDIIGDAGDIKCPKENMIDCLRTIERDYFFYLALENSFDEDYVTEKVLLALQHYAIPVVFGGANYTRMNHNNVTLKSVHNLDTLYLEVESIHTNFLKLRRYPDNALTKHIRFMPDGIYLNGWKLKPKALAKEMADIINDKERYYSFFKWHNHYSYHASDESPDTDYLCKMCEMLHNEELMKKTTVYTDFRKWWNSPGSCRLNAGKVRG